IEPTIVTSKPSRIHVIPSAMTTSQCHRLQGSRSSRRGMSVRTVSPRGSSRTSSNAAALMAPPFVRLSLPGRTQSAQNGYGVGRADTQDGPDGPLPRGAPGWSMDGMLRVLLETWVAALLVLSALALWAAVALEPERLD